MILIIFSAIYLTAVSLLKFLKSTSIGPMCIATASGWLLVSYSVLNPKS